MTSGRVIEFDNAAQHHDEPDAGFALLSRRRLSVRWADQGETFRGRLRVLGCVEGQNIAKTTILSWLSFRSGQVIK